MIIYWTLKSVPELAPLPRKQRRRVHHKCLRRHFWGAPATRRSVSAYLGSTVVMASIMIFGNSVLRVFEAPDRFWLILIPVGFASVVGEYLFSLFAIPVLRPFYPDSIGTPAGLMFVG